MWARNDPTNPPKKGEGRKQKRPMCNLSCEHRKSRTVLPACSRSSSENCSLYLKKEGYNLDEIVSAFTDQSSRHACRWCAAGGRRGGSLCRHASWTTCCPDVDSCSSYGDCRAHSQSSRECAGGYCHRSCELPRPLGRAESV